MKRILVLLSTILLIAITSSSQTIWNKDSLIAISPLQLKQTNLIFIEHKKLLNENLLLNRQITNYKQSNIFLLQKDSIKSKQLSTYMQISDDYKNQIEELNKDLIKKDKKLFAWKVGGISLSVGLLIWLLVK